MSDENMNQEEVVAETLPAGHVRVSASGDAGNGKVEASFIFDFTTSAADAIETFGDTCVHERFIRAAKIEAQARMRELLKVGKPPAEVQAHMEESWYPGASSVNTEVNILAKFSAMSEEERAALLAQLQERQNS